jgi:hypothetical protein
MYPVRWLKLAAIRQHSCMGSLPRMFVELILFTVRTTARSLQLKLQPLNGLHNLQATPHPLRRKSGCIPRCREYQEHPSSTAFCTATLEQVGYGVIRFRALCKATSYSAKLHVSELVVIGDINTRSWPDVSRSRVAQFDQIQLHLQTGSSTCLRSAQQLSSSPSWERPLPRRPGMAAGRVPCMPRTRPQRKTLTR